MCEISAQCIQWALFTVAYLNQESNFKSLDMEYFFPVADSLSEVFDM